MLEVISQHLCREYTITCPACGQDNVFPRLKPDIYRARQAEADGHPTEVSWRAEVEFPKWVTPLNYFWAVCPQCQFTGQLDDATYRTLKKNARKYQSQYIDGVLTTLSDLADEKRGIAYELGTAIPTDDIFGTQIAQFFLGIFTECLNWRTSLPSRMGQFCTDCTTYAIAPIGQTRPTHSQRPDIQALRNGQRSPLTAS